MQPADRHCGCHFQRGGTAHARTQRQRAVDGGVEPAEMHAASAQLRQHPFHVIRPVGRRVGFEVGDGKGFRPGKRGGNQLHPAIRPRRGRHGNIFVHRHGHDEALVVIGVIAEHFEPARRRDDVRGCVVEVLLIQSGSSLRGIVGFQFGEFTF